MPATYSAQPVTYAAAPTYTVQQPYTVSQQPVTYSIPAAPMYSAAPPTTVYAVPAARPVTYSTVQPGTYSLLAGATYQALGHGGATTREFYVALHYVCGSAPRRPLCWNLPRGLISGVSLKMRMPTKGGEG